MNLKPYYKKILDTENFIVQYDDSTKTYKVSYFEDGHFQDECYFTVSQPKKEVQKPIIRHCKNCKWHKPLSDYYDGTIECTVRHDRYKVYEQRGKAIWCRYYHRSMDA